MSGETLQGRRLPDSIFGEPGGGWENWKDSQPGDYMIVRRELQGKDALYIRDPAGRVGACRDHAVTEHEDGTITVSPSIFDAPDGWHGWLERGVWRSV